MNTRSALFWRVLQKIPCWWPQAEPLHRPLEQSPCFLSSIFLPLFKQTSLEALHGAALCPTKWKLLSRGQDVPHATWQTGRNDGRWQSLRLTLHLAGWGSSYHLHKMAPGLLVGSDTALWWGRRSLRSGTCRYLHNRHRTCPGSRLQGEQKEWMGPDIPPLCSTWSKMRRQASELGRK